jgi:hypothetical protein
LPDGSVIVNDKVTRGITCTTSEGDQPDGGVIATRRKEDRPKNIPVIKAQRNGGM